ncbi:MAG: 30S ribosomal protein S12 methylthiotransferase RimO [Desulfobulbaceae bacterium]|nr:30S ribosomal protein S12 methylthiotransferase RimO [Desulfobulbaceae bacterium]
MSTFHLISLGCAKNLVDSEVMLGALTLRGWKFEAVPEAAEVLLLNTCGFIQPAVEEAIEEIFALVELKERYPEKKIVVVGCFVQRYRESLVEELPEVDLFVGTEGPEQLPDLLELMMQKERPGAVVVPDTFLMTNRSPRLISTPFYRAWLKITEGCNNRCSYCKIPSIRGDLRSRTSDDLLLEAQRLEGLGVKELSIIAQDTTAHGDDLGKSENIVVLLEKLLENTSLPWLRLLYLYPTRITRELIDILAAESRVVPYLDIPFQHVNDRVLQSMNRPYGFEQLTEMVESLRRAVPDIALRTTFLVGFPGETETEFLQIEKFLRDYRLDHVGVFAYTNEEGAPSEKFPDQLPEEEKARRQNYLLKVQAEMSESIQQKYVGRTEDVIVEGVSEETDLLLQGRTKYQAPEVDGCVYINDGTASTGDIVSVHISEAKIYDLVGGIVK